MHLSLVIPCYNEAKNLPLLIQRCQATINSHPDIDIILVDNGSSDDTPAILQQQLEGQERIRQVRVAENQGYGYGILAGLKAAKGEIIGWTHADLQTDPADCLKAIDFFEKSNSPKQLFVKGRRYGRSPADVFFTVGMSCFESLLLGQPLWDINAQPTLFHRDFFQHWDLPPHDFSLDLFAYHEAVSQQLAVKRFPVKFSQRAHGHSHWNIDWKSKWGFIKRTMLFSFALRRQRKDKSIAL